MKVISNELENYEYSNYTMWFGLLNIKIFRSGIIRKKYNNIPPSSQKL